MAEYGIVGWHGLPKVLGSLRKNMYSCHALIKPSLLSRIALLRSRYALKKAAIEATIMVLRSKGNDDASSMPATSAMADCAI